MKHLIALLVLLACSASSWGTTYFLANASTSPVGSDANSGADLAHPWLTPNHAVNCGDVIQAAASTAYVGTNFRYNTWGVVTCPAGNNVAWLKCITFDACKITASGTSNPVAVTGSYWGVQGFEVTASANSNACFIAYPSTGSTSTHHVIFANNVANGCYAGGFGAGQASTAGVDYLAVIGNIAYNAAKDSGGCYSGIDIFMPVNTDTLPGTHLYIAGNLSYGNVNPNPCGGGVPTDGEGVILDTLDGSSDSLIYTGQVVVDNNILLSNGGRGIQVFHSAAATYARIYFRQNTLWGNNTDTNQTNTLCGEVLLVASFGVEAFGNLAATSAATGCASASPLYAYSISGGNGTDHVYANTGWATSGTFTQLVSSAGFAYGPNNVTSTTLAFTSATIPSAPSCGSFANVPACMAAVVANFTPTTVAAKGYGYQVPSATQVYDPLFPQWLCGVTNMPAGLVTMGCLTGSRIQ